MSDADLRLLRVFSAVVECGGFAAAQALLNVSESTISTHMHDLETRLGLRLCQRGRGGFRLTEDGEVVFKAASDLFGSLDRFQGQIAARKRQLSGPLVIGMPDNIITHPEFPLAPAVDRFYARDNAVHLAIEVLTPRELERGVIEGRLHLAIAPRHQRVAGLHYEKLLSEPNYFYCGRKHSLFAQTNRKLSFEEIAAQGLVGRGYISNFDQRFFKDAPHHVTAYSMEASAVLILSGRFGGFLPSYYAQRWVVAGEMRALRPDVLSYTPDFFIVTSKGAELGLVAKTFYNDLRAAAVVSRKAK